MEYDVVFGPVLDLYPNHKGERKWIRFLQTKDKTLYIETAEIDPETGIVNWGEAKRVPPRNSGNDWYVYDPLQNRVFQLRRNNSKLEGTQYAKFNGQFYLRETDGSRHVIYRLGKYGQQEITDDGLEFHHREVKRVETATSYAERTRALVLLANEQKIKDDSNRLNWPLVGKRRHINHILAYHFFISLGEERESILDFFLQHLINIKETTDSQDEYCSALRYLMNFSTKELNKLNPRTLSAIIIFQREILAEPERNQSYYHLQTSLQFELKDYTSKICQITKRSYDDSLVSTFNQNYKQVLTNKVMHYFDQINRKQKPAVQQKAILNLMSIYNDPNCWKALSSPVQAKLLFTLKQARNWFTENEQLSKLISMCPLNLDANENCIDELTLLIRVGDRDLKLKEVTKLSQSKNELVWWAILQQPSLRRQLVQQSTLLNLMHEYPNVAELCVKDKNILEHYTILRVQLFQDCRAPTHARAAHQLYQLYPAPSEQVLEVAQAYDYDRERCLNEFEQLAFNHIDLAIQMIEEDSLWLRRENSDALLAELVKNNKNNSDAISQLVNALYDNPRLKPKSLQFVELCREHVDDPNILDDFLEIMTWLISLLYKPKQKEEALEPVTRQVSLNV